MKEVRSSKRYKTVRLTLWNVCALGPGTDILEDIANEINEVKLRFNLHSFKVKIINVVVSKALINNKR